MQKSKNQPASYHTLSETLTNCGFPPPQHPLMALINAVDNTYEAAPPPHRQMLRFYKISYRVDMGGTLSYGRTRFDFLEGGLFFAAPRQLVGSEADLNATDGEPAAGSCLTGQITILIHPDFLIGYPLAQKIKQFNFFSYTVNEALLLSEKEKLIILDLLRNIETELDHPLDEISQDIIVSQLDLFFSYAQRFYKRQFISRGPVIQSTVEKAKALLDAWFEQTAVTDRGLPSVQQLAAQLNISAGYLSDLVRSATGLSAQGFIHEVLIEKAKEALLGTALSVSEIAYQLGFEHPQSFSKLFKLKTSKSPLAFRASFN